MDGKAFLTQHFLIFLDCLVALFFWQILPFRTIGRMPHETTTDKAVGVGLKILASVILFAVWFFFLGYTYIKM